PADDGDLRQARLARRTDALGTLGALGTRAAGPLARRTFDAFGAVGVFETFTVFAILTALSARGAFDGRRRTLTVVDVVLRRERREHALEQRRHALAVQRGDALRLAQAELVKLGLGDLAEHALGFVDGHDDGLVARAQALRDAAVLLGKARLVIDDEDDGVGFLDRDLDLLGNERRHAFGEIVRQAACIDDDEPAALMLAESVATVAR